MGAACPGPDRAKHMGELKRGDDRWDVFIETQADAELGAVRGRVHFVTAERRRTTGWIFLELSGRDIQERFGEFAAVELRHLGEARADERGAVNSGQRTHGCGS